MIKLSVFSIASAWASFFTKADWLFFLGLVVTVINAVIEYLRYREEKKVAESG